MTLTGFIRYRIDPLRREALREYAQHGSRIIARCGGGLLGDFLPHEGRNGIASGSIAFARAKRFILGEERSFLENVELP